jgi:hypothetical protein
MKDVSTWREIIIAPKTTGFSIIPICIRRFSELPINLTAHLLKCVAIGCHLKRMRSTGFLLWLTELPGVPCEKRSGQKPVVDDLTRFF